MTQAHYDRLVQILEERLDTIQDIIEEADKKFRSASDAMQALADARHALGKIHDVIAKE